MKQLLSLFFVCFLIHTNSFAQITLYVATNGNDAAKGSKDAPLATIEKAQQQARSIKTSVTILVRGGKYYLNKPITFTPADSRKKTNAITYAAYPREQVIISGAAPLQLQWQPYKNGIMQAKVNGNFLFDELYVNGILQHMARYPNYDSSVRILQGTAADADAPTKAAQWSHPEGGFIHGLHKSEWGSFDYLIKGKTDSNKLVLDGGYQNNRQHGLHEKYKYAENIFEELDTTGEWYYNKITQTLYYYPPASINLSTANIEAAKLSELFVFKGTEQQPVSYITIKGFTLQHTARTFMQTKEPLLRSDWTIYRGGAILLDGATNCAVTNCYLHELGGNGIFFSNYNRNNSVSGCHINNTGASAICFVGDPNAVRNPLFEYNENQPFVSVDKTPGPKTNNYPANCTVYNNLIHNIGRLEKQGTGVELSMSMNITVSHNTIYDVPRAGLNIGDGTWGGHILEYNDVFNTVLETGDHGSFNSWGRDRYWSPNYNQMDSLINVNPRAIFLDAVQTTIIRNNRFRCDHGWDIDLDDGSSNYHIYNNLCLNGGLKLREGAFRTVENNIIINNSFHPHVWLKNSNDIFRKNIVTEAYKPIGDFVWGKQVDYNIFTDSISLAKYQQDGRDVHAVVVKDPFVNAAAGNYTVKANTTILKAGFKPFDTKNYGVVSLNLKAIAKQINIPRLVKENADKDDIIDFLGMHVKSLNSLAERSATGMPEKKGVFILKVNDGKNAAKVFQKNDVILGCNGTAINTINDLQKLVIAKNGLLDFTIFRGQKEQHVKITFD